MTAPAFRPHPLLFAAMGVAALVGPAALAWFGLRRRPARG
jgi:hypothetical protein